MLFRGDGVSGAFLFYFKGTNQPVHILYALRY